jgi:hypothetical protein
LRFDGAGPSTDENEVRRSPYFAWLCRHKIKAIKATSTAISMTLYRACFRKLHSNVRSVECTSTELFVSLRVPAVMSSSAGLTTAAKTWEWPLLVPFW